MYAEESIDSSVEGLKENHSINIVYDHNNNNKIRTISWAKKLRNYDKQSHYTASKSR